MYIVFCAISISKSKSPLLSIVSQPPDREIVLRDQSPQAHSKTNRLWQLSVLCSLTIWSSPDLASFLSSAHCCSSTTQFSPFLPFLRKSPTVEGKEVRIFNCFFLFLFKKRKEKNITSLLKSYMIFLWPGTHFFLFTNNKMSICTTYNTIIHQFVYFPFKYGK